MFINNQKPLSYHHHHVLFLSSSRHSCGLSPTSGPFAVGPEVTLTRLLCLEPVIGIEKMHFTFL
jgi:hypothetical protein